MRTYLFDLLLCISSAVDLIAPELSTHHQQVAYLSYRIADQMGFEKEKCSAMVMAGLVHDIGAMTKKERLSIIEQEPVTVNNHAFRSAKLLEEVSVLSPIVETVRYHHVPWDYGNGREFMGRAVPLESHILHLADRVCAAFKSNGNPIEQVPFVFNTITEQTDIKYMPEAVEALKSMQKTEHIWLELLDPSPLSFLPMQTLLSSTVLNIDQTLEFTKMISFIIDFRSHFTATHSAGVASVAHLLSKYFSFSEYESKMILIAGYLHDLGKFSVPNELLEKQSALNEKEFDIIRGHTFHTYRLLNMVRGFEIINQWASYHHEKLNGKGYPFHLDGTCIPLGARIMAVADIFTSLTEDRPYRNGMSMEQVAHVLNSLVDNGSICGNVVTTLLESHEEFRNTCVENQRREEAVYSHFFDVAK